MEREVDIVIYLFNRNQEAVGVISNDTPNGLNYYNDLHTQGIQDNLNTLEFYVRGDIEDAYMLEVDGYVVYRDINDESHMFIIKQIEDLRGDTFERKVLCEHVAIGDLIATVVRPTTETLMSVELYVTQVLADSDWNVGNTYTTEERAIGVEGYTTALEALHHAMSVFEGEMVYRIEFKNNKVIGKYIDVVDQRGNKDYKIFEYGKSVTGIKRTEDSSDVITALVGVGKDNLTFASMSNTSVTIPEGYTRVEGTDYIISEEAYQNFNRGTKHIFGVYKDDSETQLDLFNATLAKLKELEKPLLTYECHVVTLERLPGYKHMKVDIGDTVYVKDFSHDIPIMVEARVMELKRSNTDPSADSVTLGDYKTIDLANYNWFDELRSRVDKTQLELGTKENIVLRQDTPPSSTSNLWLDTSKTVETGGSGTVSGYVLKEYSPTEGAWVATLPPVADTISDIKGTAPKVDQLATTIGYIYNPYTYVDGSGATIQGRLNLNPDYISFSEYVDNTNPSQLDTVYSSELTRNALSIRGDVLLEGGTPYATFDSRLNMDGISFSRTGTLHNGFSILSDPTSNTLPTYFNSKGSLSISSVDNEAGYGNMSLTSDGTMRLMSKDTGDFSMEMFSYGDIRITAGYGGGVNDRIVLNSPVTTVDPLTMLGDVDTGVGTVVDLRDANTFTKPEVSEDKLVSTYFVSPWNSHATYPFTVTKSTDGIVTLNGLVQGGTQSNTNYAINLPNQYAPKSSMVFHIPSYTGKMIRIRIAETTGLIYIETYGGTLTAGEYVCFNGISYPTI